MGKITKRFNMNDLKGKRLLFLGAIRALCEPIELAKKMGIYTIALDYLPNSPAKKVADKAYLVSTTDIDAVCEVCKNERVDGVFTAFTDSMLPYARKICDKMGFPFYASMEQIKLSLDKRFFKEKCRENGVPVPMDYTKEIEKSGLQNANICYPVIVKPIDSSGGRGIRVCQSKDELNIAYEYAMSVSPGKNVLVEEYVIGDEITATYTMKNGEISLSCLKDKLVSRDHENITSQSDVLIMPSRYLTRYMSTVNDSVIKMLKNLNATDGTIFLQGVATDNKMVFFECGYRVNGSCDYRHIERENSINYMKMMLAHAVCGDMAGYELSMDNPFFSKYILTFNMWAHGGKIGSQQGLDEVLKIENVSFAEYMHDVGDELVDNNTLSQRVFRAIIIDSSIDEIKNTIQKIQAFVSIKNENEQNMLYSSFDIKRLNDYDKEL